MLLIGFESMNFKAADGKDVSGVMCYFAEPCDAKRGKGVRPCQRKTSTGAVKNWFFTDDRLLELNFYPEVNVNYNLTFDYRGAIVGFVKA